MKKIGFRRDQQRIPREEEPAVFESMRAYRGVIFRKEEHLARLFESAKTSGLKIRASRAELSRALDSALRESGRKEAFVRITVNPRTYFIIVAEKGYPPDVYLKGVSVVTTPVRKGLSHSAYPEAKTPSYGPAILATLGLPEGNVETVFMSLEGTVLEGRTSNVFMIKNNCLWTPPAAGIIDGVTRREVLDCSKVLGLGCREAYFTRHDLFNAEEAFLTNTSGEILPIREVDGRAVGREVPGPWTRKLHEEFRRRVLQAVTKGSGPSGTGARGA